ncbi:MAG: prolyl oligopeptidase family serine peptidase [Gemmataceae bacterium]
MTRRAAIVCSLILVSGQPARADDADPYRWLEDVTGDKALAWVREQNSGIERLTASAEFKALDARILKALDSDARIPVVSKSGPYFYNFWRDAKHRRGLWRRTTLDEYRKTEPAWETVLDLDALARQEKENWVWGAAAFLNPAYERCLISLSRGGSDANVTREFDVKAKSFVAGGFALPEAKSRVAWRDHDCLYVATDFGPGSLTASGYPRVVKEWTRGTPLDQAAVVFEGQPSDMSVAAFRDRTPGFERDFVSRSVSFFTREQFLRKDGRLIKIDKPNDATVGVRRDLMTVVLRSPWTVGGATYPAGAVLAIDFDSYMRGDRKFDVLFQPSERTSFAGLIRTRNYVVINELDNVHNRLTLLSRKEGQWHREPLPGVPRLGSVDAWAVDSDNFDSDEYFLSARDFLTPETLSLGKLPDGPSEKLKAMPSFFDATGLTVRQHEVASKDGTRIPYFEVSRENLKLDGKTPTLLYGYGGFRISEVPAYNSTAGMAWLERGGVYVVANIRGGGEFGPAWHQAALKANRHRAYEDFAAVAEDLIRRKVTSPAHLGCMGGSNGGLLVGNMLTLRPDLWGAVVCRVPLLDMQRYHKLLAGASWMAEYGDPDKADEWEFIRTFSPYHNVSPGAKYPPTLFTTSTRDDRVHPGHARKMVAKMKGLGHDVLYYENTEGGHAGAADNKQQAFMSALCFTFLWDRLK